MSEDARDFFPDFFIVGAPRCGTTALSKYLKRNPKICFSNPKEPHFFTKILEERPEADIQTEYVERFYLSAGVEVGAIE